MLRKGARHSIRAHILDAVVWERLTAILTDPQLVAREVARLREDDPAADDLAALDRAITGIERQRTNLSRAVALADETMLPPRCSPNSRCSRSESANS